MEGLSWAGAVKEYWPQILFVAGIFTAFVKLFMRVEVLEEKVKAVFQLWNDKGK